MKFDFNWQSGFWENYDIIFWLDSNVSDLGLKVNLDFWNLFIDTRFKISSENNDFGFHSIKTINFLKKNPIQMH